MRVLFNAEQLRLMFESARSALNRLERDYKQVLDRDPRQSHDGYPVQSLGGARRAGKGRHADPTHTVAVQLVDGDAVGSDVAKLFGSLHQASRLLEQADSLRARVLPPEKKPEADETLWCKSCLRVEHSDHRGRTELVHTPAREGCPDCWACHRYANANDGEWPPLVLVAMHHAGRRVYERDVARAKAGELQLPPGYRVAASKNGRR